MHNVEYQNLVGKPYRLGARGPEYFDCWGICLELGKRVGINYPAEFTPVETIDQDKAISDGLDKDFIKIDRPEPFCIVTFKVNPPFVDHCGIVLPDCLRFLHTMKNHSTCINRLDHRILNKRIEGFYRLTK